MWLLGFQLILGFAEYLVIIPLAIGVAGVGVLEEWMPDGAFETVLTATLFSILLVNAYASLHAPEVVYFYGLRSLRSQLPADALEGDWVARGLRGVREPQSPELPACPSCGALWNPEDYRKDAEHIYCSTCKAELERPG